MALYDIAQSTRDKHQAVGSHLRFLEWFGRPIRPGARVLDFGCGVGHSVAVLLELGFDAYGCDVREWWGKDNRQARADGVTYLPPPHVINRLRSFNPTEPSLPFPADHFDLCTSDQVMEHVFDHTTAFRQIAGILKPDAISLHRFPGPNTLFEGHVYLPFPAICHSKAYLAAWALAGHRAPSQRGQAWRDVLNANVRVMQTVNYTTKRHLRACARDARVTIDFLEAHEMQLRDVGAAAKLVARARPFGLDGLLTRLLSPLAQRYMMLARACVTS